MPDRPPPRFTGVTTYKDRLGRFSIRYPTDWAELRLEEQDGAMFAPTPDDLATYFAVWVSSLEHAAVAEDLDILRAAVNEGLARLPECAIESEYDVPLGNAIKLERVFTFREGEATRKRKQWLFYVDTWLMVLTWQGASPEDYEHWLAMANYSFATFTLPEALWFATDPEMAARGPASGTSI
jgi:hypothetical protein